MTNKDLVLKQAIYRLCETQVVYYPVIVFLCYGSEMGKGDWQKWLSGASRPVILNQGVGATKFLKGAMSYEEVREVLRAKQIH